MNAVLAHNNAQAVVYADLIPDEPGTNVAPFAGIRIPTLILTGEIDSLANSGATSTQAASQGKVAKYVAAQVKRLMDEATRYTSFIRSKATDMSAFAQHGSHGAPSHRASPALGWRIQSACASGAPGHATPAPQLQGANKEAGPWARPSARPAGR